MENTTTSPAKHTVRPPSPEELRQLWDFYVEDGKVEMYMLEQDTWLDGLWIAVFDDYFTGSPGYTGKVMYVVWDGAPYACDVFGWTKGTLELFQSYGA